MALLDLQTLTCAPRNHSKMIYTIPHSKLPSVNPLQNNEQFVSVSGDNSGLLAALPGSSTLEANRAYDQVGKAPHLYEMDF